jgi:Copper resistance protein ScsC N-terminal domain
MPSFRLLIPALFAVALCGAPMSASAQSFTDTQRGDIETIVRNYLIAHPEVLEEAMTELSKRQAAAEAATHPASPTTPTRSSIRRATSRSATRMATSPSSNSSITIAATASAR